MKKFLSLLLAMTMVMSLIVLPARAEDGVTASAAKANLELNINDRKSTEVTFSGLSDTAGVTYQWTASSDSVVELTNATQAIATATAKAAGSVTLTCTATKNEQTVGTASCSVTVYDYKKAITAITYNGRSYNVTNNADSHTATVNYVASEVAEAATPAWDVVAAGYTATLKTAPSGKTGNLQVVYTVKSPADSTGQDVTVAANMTEVSAPTVNISSPAADACIADQNVTFAVSAPASLPTGASYVWSYKVKDSESKPTTLEGTPSGQNFTFKAPSTPGNYTIYCAIKLGRDAVTANSTGINIKVSEDKNKYTVTAPTAATSELNGKTVNYGFKFENTAVSPAVAIPLNGTNITWTATGGGATFTTKTVTGNADGTAANTLTLGNTAGNVTVKATFTYLGKNYTVNFPTVTNVVPTYTLGSTYCGYNNSVYRANELVSYANSALSAAGITGVTASSVALASASSNVVTATGTPITGYTLTASATYLGTADLTATVTKSTGGTFTMTFKVPVLPIPYSTSLGTVNAEPYTTGSTYYNNTYRVTLPTTFNQYYVVSKNTTPNYNVSAAPASGVTTVTLNQNDFVNGQCTLYVIAWNSNYNSYGYGYNYGKYYSGAITVTQTNHDIKYNGVVGNTVQFKHNDFTTFMNEMYGTNTTSYLTFNSVKFTSVPNATTQGTLYYNGVAMTTGYGSNYFNTSTAVTNLDNVSFSVSSRVPSTTKEIRIPFTLYATRYNSYGSYGTGSGTSVTYSGAVVISLVREDVTFTVAPGDAVTFTDSAFLNYLRAQSGINYNYNIDYVTFDQSAVDTINGGVLYSGYAGYNQVKTTDKFYYTTTNNYTQNALSDVTFRASLYAKTGTTVYIPFTIYAKYGTSSAATRQVTGTVAVKIAQTMNFVDVKPTDYFYNPVKWAVTKNITKGTSAVTFSPDKTCTRAEIVTFLWRDAGSPMPTISRHPFTDVSYSMGADFYNAILWASQNGITAGTSTTTFSPNKTCTRAEIVTFLWRYAKKPVGYGSNSFTDVNKNDHAPYYDAILWAVSKGITNGSTTTTFAPNGTCTRAQAVTFLYRYEGGK